MTGKGKDLDSSLALYARWKRFFDKLETAGLILLVPMTIVALLVIAFNVEVLKTPLIVIVCIMFPLLCIGALGNTIVGGKSKKLAAGYTPTVLARVMDRLDKYDHESSVSDDYIRQELGYPFYDRIGERSDYVKGVLRGIPLEMGEFSLEKRTSERDEDGNVSYSWDTVFEGLMVVCRHGMELSNDFTITQYMAVLGGLETESVDFNRAFSITTRAQHETFYLLTPHYMETLLRLTAEKGRIFGMRFLSDGTLLLTLRGWDLFEVGDSTNTAELSEKLEREVMELGDLLEALEIPREGENIPMGKRGEDRNDEAG